ncbi:MAG: sialidase family protein, partial [Nitrososphaeraceae archaeon]
MILNGAYVHTVIAGSEVNTVDRLLFSEPVNLTNNQHDSVYAQVATHGSNVYMVWQENPQSYDVSNDNPNYDIFMKKSIDGGITFGKEINLSNNPGFSEHPQIAASGNNVYIVWIDNSPIIGSSEISENKKILLRKSVDNGNTFGETTILSSNNSVDSINQEITATGNNVYVVWQDTPLAAAEDADVASGGHNGSAYNNAYNSSNTNHEKYGRIMFTSSENSGGSFIKPKSLNYDAYKSYPKVGAYGDSVYVVWNIGIINKTSDGNSQNGMGPNGVFLSRSSDNGINFSDPLKLNDDLQSVGESQVATNGKNVYVVWG